MKMTVQARLPTRLPRLHYAPGHAVNLAEYTKYVQKSLPISQKPFVNSRAVARMLRAQGYDIAAGTNNRRVILNVALALAPAKDFEFVNVAGRARRIYM